MNLPRQLFIMLVFIIFTLEAAPQTIYSLNLESSIQLGKEKSRTMQMLQQDLKKASYDLKVATSGFRTHIYADMVLPRYTETIRQWEDSSGISFYPVRQNVLNGYLTINQPLPTDGTLFIRSGLQSSADFFANDRNAQMTTQLGLTQPVAAFFGYNDLRQRITRARLNYDLSSKRLNREELNLVYDISQAFFNLVSYHERVNIARLTRDRQQEAFDIAKNKLAAGLIREVESLQMEVDLSEAVNNLDLALVDFFSQEQLYKEVLGLELSDSVVIESDLVYQPVTVDVEMAVEMAMNNRLELKENEIRIELAKMTVKQQKAAGMISGNIDVDYNLQGVDKSDLSIPIGTSLNNTWQNLTGRSGSFGVGLTLRIPILDWGENRARVNSSVATLDRYNLELSAEKIAIEGDIRSTVARLQSSLRRLQLLEINVTTAEKSFEISRTRYSNGDIDSQAMALERERLNNAYISRLNAYIDYKLRLSDLMRKTFFDFEKNISVTGV